MKDLSKIWSVCNQKGGCGKTTIAMHIAGELFLKKKHCIVIDVDQQNSATEWFSLKEKNQRLPFPVMNFAQIGISLHQKIAPLTQKFEYIIIDCPPAVESDVMKSALMISDLAIIPFVPSGIDMLALIALHKRIEEIKLKNKHLKAKIVLNRVESRPLNTQKVLKLLKEFKIDLLNSVIKKRITFKEVVLEGTLVQFMPKKNEKACTEIANLVQELLYDSQ